MIILFIIIMIVIGILSNYILYLYQKKRIKNIEENNKITNMQDDKS